MDIEYVFQETDKLPEGYSIQKERVKPYGTGHAVWCARDAITAPFAVINADDFYGRSSYMMLHSHLANEENMCMVGYRLRNTLTENGTVSRGVCEVENNILKSVTEHTAIDSNSGIPIDVIVSMNMWGFDLGIFPFLEEKLRLFLDENKNDLKAEFLLPNVVTKRIKEQNKNVTVLNTNEKWYGVTYREDSESVKKAMSD